MKTNKQKKRDLTVKSAMARIREASLYPSIAINLKYGDLELRRELERLSRTYWERLEPGQKKILRNLKSKGWRTHVTEGAKFSGRNVDRYGEDLIYHFGGQFWALLPPKIHTLFPPHSLFFYPAQGGNFGVEIDCLLKYKSSYYPRDHECKVQHEGKTYTLAYSSHAFDRLSERCLSGDIRYETQCLFHGFLKSARYHWCNLPDLGPLVLEGWMAGNNWDESRKDEQIFGYCPIILDGDWAIAKTFLTPGLIQTPEGKLLVHHAGERIELKEVSSALSRVFVDPVVAEWFNHCNLPLFRPRGSDPVLNRGEKVNWDLPPPSNWRDLLLHPEKAFYDIMKEETDGKQPDCVCHHHSEG